jgi:protein-disulfide isomerase
MLVFSDFECPFCARFANEVMPTLRQQYVDPGKVKLAFRHLPLTMHTHAERAAESAECAARQGRFWAMHDSLFQTPVRLDEPDLEAHARDVGLDLAAFATCMGGEESRAAVSADAGAARGLGVTATPAILIGIATADASVRVLEVIPGARPVDEFAKALDRALADKG